MTGKNPLGNGREPQSYEGLNIVVPIGGWQLVKSVRSPTTNDKKYPIGTMWINTTTSVSYQLVTAPGIWTILGSAVGGDIQTLTADSGGALNPTLGNITIAGTAAKGIVSSGAGSTITITASDATTAQKGVLVTASNAQAIAGTGTTQAVTPLALANKLGPQTLNGVLLGNGTTLALSSVAVGLTGQVLTGVTGDAPMFASIPTLNIVNVTAATQAMAVGTSYVANAAASTVVFTLPATAAQGDRMEIVGNGPGGWQINQNASQSIKLATQSSVTGVAGFVASTSRYDSVELYCVVAGASTIWNIKSSSGSLTFGS